MTRAAEHAAHVARQAENLRRARGGADLSAPTDERVKRLIKAVKAMPDDWCCDDDCDPCAELRAALRDMGGE